MTNRSFNIGNATWDKLRSVKKNLDTKNGKIVPWDNAFEYIFSFMDGKPSNTSKNEKDGLQPGKQGISSPNLPPKSTPPVVDLNIPSPTPRGGQKNLPKLEIKLPSPQISSTPKVLPKTTIAESYGDTDDDLGIPAAPKKKAIVLDVDSKKLEDMAKKETAETKYILIECQICGSNPIVMPVPKKLVLEATEPVVDVSYIHGAPQHVVVAQLDHDFQVRRRRASWPVFEKDFQ